MARIGRAFPAPQFIGRRIIPQVVGTLTLSDIVANTGVGQSGQAGVFHVFDDAGVGIVVSKSGTVSGGDDVVLTDPLIITGTWYRVYILLANGKHGVARVQAS
jgi:hypothetical protein